MPADVVGTAKKLYALAADNANVNEARNAAFSACQILLKEVDRLRKENAALRAEQRRRSSARAVVDSFDGLSELFSGAAAGATRAGPAAPPPPQPAVPETPKRAPDPQAKTIPILNSTAVCSICGQRILRGKFATWSRGQVFHPTCWESETR